MTARYTKILKPIPKQTSLEKLFWDCNEIVKIVKIIPKKIKINNKEPRNPNCSAKTVKIKSVCFSGRNSKLLCDPCLKPLPKKPAEPIAIFD